MIRSIKGVDLFRKVTQDFHQSTALGGMLSVISLIGMLLLVLSEFYTYNYAPAKPYLQVEPHSDEDYILLLVNITFPNSPCNSLVTFFTDSTKHHYKFFSLQRTVLDHEGKELNIEPQTDFYDKVEGCGSCYGAESEWRRCCNSCAEVMEAYGGKSWKPPVFADIQQCSGFVSKETVSGPGCRISGTMDIKKMPGSVHFKNVLNLDRRTAQMYSAAHKIDKFLFVDPKSDAKGIVGPLDGVVVERGFLINYYLKLMPAVRNQGRFYEASTNNLVFERIMNPEIIFTYDIEPITTIYDREKSLVKFLVNVCAIIGGWFAITVFLSRLIIK